MRLTCQIINDEVNIIKRVRLNFNDVKPCNIKVYRDRLNVAVDNYVNPGQIAFFIHTTQHGSINGQGSFFQIYDFDRLNTMLEGINNGGVLKMSSKKVKKTLLTEIRCNKIPYNTFQSFDIDGSNLYLCGGHMDKGAMIHKIKYKTNVKTQSITNVTQQIKITPSIFANGRQLGGSELEIEGMKVTSAGGNKVNYFINFFMAKVPISNTISVYKFTK